MVPLRWQHARSRTGPVRHSACRIAACTVSLLCAACAAHPAAGATRHRLRMQRTTRLLCRHIMQTMALRHMSTTRTSVRVPSAQVYSRQALHQRSSSSRIHRGATRRQRAACAAADEQSATDTILVDVSDARSACCILPVCSLHHARATGLLLHGVERARPASCLQRPKVVTEAWQRILDMQKAGQLVTSKIETVNRGGVIITVEGIQGTKPS